MRTQLVVVVAVLLLPQLAATTVAPGAANIAQPGCPSKCGKVVIPYPFGLANHTHYCYRKGFKVTCHRPHGGAPRLLLGTTTEGPEVLKISLKNGTVRIRSKVRSCHSRI
jgi:hypothetical protein